MFGVAKEYKNLNSLEFAIFNFAFFYRIFFFCYNIWEED